MENSTQAGIVSAILGNIAINLACNLERYAKYRIVRLALHGFHAPKRTDYLRYLAITLLITGQLTNLLAYGLAPASVVSPLGVLAVISNCIIPPLIFDEHPSLHNITGATIALPGVLLLILSAPRDDQLAYPLEPLGKLFLAGLCCVASICSLIRTRATSPKILLRADSALTAVMGAFCVLCIKCMGLIVLSKDESKGQLLLVLILVATVSGVLQVAMILNVFSLYPLWQAVPHLFAFFTVFVAMGSAIIFHEFKRCGFLSKLEFVVGCALIMAGVWVSAKPHDPAYGFQIKTRRALNGPKKRRKRNNKSKAALPGPLPKIGHISQTQAPTQSSRKPKTRAKRPRHEDYYGLKKQANLNYSLKIRSRSNSRRRSRSRPRSNSCSQSYLRPYSSHESWSYSAFPASMDIPYGREPRRRYPGRTGLPHSWDTTHVYEREIIVPAHPGSSPAEASIELDEHAYLLIPKRLCSPNTSYQSV